MGRGGWPTSGLTTWVEASIPQPTKEQEDTVEQAPRKAQVSSRRARAQMGSQARRTNASVWLRSPWHSGPCPQSIVGFLPPNITEHQLYLAQNSTPSIFLEHRKTNLLVYQMRKLRLRMMKA